MSGKELAVRSGLELAARQLATVAERVVSLLVSDQVSSPAGYGQLVGSLADRAGLKTTPASGNGQRPSHFVESAKTKIIIAEHLDGLEIFYVAGSIASLLGVIPVVLRRWAGIRGIAVGSESPARHRVAVRRLNEHGKLIQDKSHDLTFPWEHALEAQLQALREEVDTLRGRLTALEAQTLRQAHREPGDKPPDR